MEYTPGEPGELIAPLRQKPGKDIWLCAGGDLACRLLEHRLVDQISVSVFPILLGDGIPLFQKGYAEADLQLTECKPYDTGVVSLRYTLSGSAMTSGSVENAQSARDVGVERSGIPKAH